MTTPSPLSCLAPICNLLLFSCLKLKGADIDNGGGDEARRRRRVRKLLRMEEGERERLEVGEGRMVDMVGW